MTHKLRRGEMGRWMVAAAAALFLGALTLGCSDDDPIQYPPPKYDTGGKKDGSINWPDRGQVKNDLWVPPQDKGTAKQDGGTTKQDGGGTPSDGGGSTDGTVSPDSGTSCPNPSGANCSSKCPSGQLCCTAKGGTCAKVVKMSGPASLAKALAPLAEALGACWKQSPAPKADNLCATIDACSMTGQLTESMLENWVCKTAKASDFSTAQALKNAQDALGCSWLPGGKDLKWKLTTALIGGAKGTICISYDVVSWWPDAVHLDLCSKYPPK